MKNVLIYSVTFKVMQLLTQIFLIYIEEHLILYKIVRLYQYFEGFGNSMAILLTPFGKVLKVNF